MRRRSRMHRPDGPPGRDVPGAAQARRVVPVPALRRDRCALRRLPALRADRHRRRDLHRRRRVLGVLRVRSGEPSLHRSARTRPTVHRPLRGRGVLRLLERLHRCLPPAAAERRAVPQRRSVRERVLRGGPDLRSVHPAGRLLLTQAATAASPPWRSTSASIVPSSMYIHIRRSPRNDHHAAFAPPQLAGLFFSKAK